MIGLLLTAVQESGIDTQRFVSLYQSYKDRVYLTAFRILKSKEMAEDAASRTWILVIENFDRVESVPEEKRGAYLVTMAKNAALNMLKKESRNAEFPGEWNDFHPVYSDEPGMRYENLVNTIRNMPEKYRQILELKFVLEWSNKEIARFLHMNESSVSSRIARGRAMLREKLEEENDGID